MFNTDVWSSGEVRATFENSQMRAAPIPLAEGVMVRVVAPDMEFAAYQMSIEPATGSTARASPASAYIFPALSVILLTVGLTYGPEPQATTIRLPLPVAGIVHVDGKVCVPQEVMWTRLMGGTGAIRLMVAVWELLPRVAVTVAL